MDEEKTYFLYLHGNVVYKDGGVIVMSRVQLDALVDQGEAVYCDQPLKFGMALYASRRATLAELETEQTRTIRRLAALHCTVPSDPAQVAYLKQRIQRQAATIEQRRCDILNEVRKLEAKMRQTYLYLEQCTLAQQRNTLLESLPGIAHIRPKLDPERGLGISTHGVMQLGCAYTTYLGYLAFTFILGALGALIFGCTPYCGGW